VVIASLLLQLLKGPLVEGISDSECCFTKEVGGIRYELLGEEDTSAYMCKSNCVYREDSDPDSVYCFKSGELPVSCINQEAPVMTQVPIDEGGETLVQENQFHEATGVLTVKVPPHKNYTETVFLLHQASNTSMMKSGGICHITDLPDHINVSKLAQGYENNDKRTVRQSDTVTTFLLKARLARYGSKQRAELHQDADYLCKDVPLVKTDDTHLTKEDWEKLDNDEIITLETDKSLRQSGECRVASSVSRVPPEWCGYAWPNPAGGGLSLHEISQAGLKVNCLLDAGCGDDLVCKCDDQSRSYCQCKEITNKKRFGFCYHLGKNLIKSVIAGNQRTTFIQEMEYKGHVDEDDIGPAVVIRSPANNGYQGLTVVMNGYWLGHWHYSSIYDKEFGAPPIKNNMMLKLGDVCHVRTLPSDTFPFDIASGIAEINEANAVTAADEEEIERVIILPDGILTQSDRNELHPDIKETCKGASLEKYTPATREQAEKLYNGEIIFLDFNDIFKTALRLDYQGSGNWRYPNERSGKLWINQIVDLVIDTHCCIDPAVCGGEEGGLCTCDQIKDKQTFDQCYFEL